MLWLHFGIVFHLGLYFRYGIYPLTAFSARQPPAPRPRAISPETAESVKSVTPEPLDIETRRVVNMICSVKPKDESHELLVSIFILNEKRISNRGIFLDDNTSQNGRQNEPSTDLSNCA